jgi:hypothetical protein
VLRYIYPVLNVWSSVANKPQLTRADQIVSELGGGADAISAAIGMVAAEKNTNPFANGNIQNVCGDPTLPATPELRGITPLIDPAVDVDGAVAALSKKTQGAPLAADGLSVFDLLDQAGLGGLVASQAATGGAAVGGAQQAKGGDKQKDAAATEKNQNGAAADKKDPPAAPAAACNLAQPDAAASNVTAPADTNNADASKAQPAGDASAKSTLGAAVDFGKCTPTITFQGGEGNRPATEFTFQIADPVARGGQGEALNPNIITNALCNQLINVCGANAAAQTACLDGKAKVAAAGTRNKSTADLFNAAVGFAGAVTNPKGGPDDVAAAAKARKMRRGVRWMQLGV